MLYVLRMLITIDFARSG